MKIRTAIGSVGTTKIAATFGLFTFSMMLALSPVSLVAQNIVDNMTLDINISQISSMEVLPGENAWFNTDPGGNGTIMNLTIKNSGSTNMSGIYMSVNTYWIETDNPLGKGNVSKYAASGFIVIRNETETLEYFPLGRLEWNLTEIMDTEVLNLGAGVTKWAHGWYRLSNGNEYLWKLENGTQTGGNNLGSWCNTTDTNLVIKLNPENGTSYNRNLAVAVATGSTDYANENWTFFYFSSGPLKGRCAAAYYDCTRIYLYKYDMADGFKECNSAAYLTAKELAPGSRMTKIKIKPSIPRGIPAGDTKTSVLTIYASTG